MVDLITSREKSRVSPGRTKRWCSAYGTSIGPSNEWPTGRRRRRAGWVIKGRQVAYSYFPVTHASHDALVRILFPIIASSSSAAGTSPPRVCAYSFVRRWLSHAGGEESKSSEAFWLERAYPSIVPSRRLGSGAHFIFGVATGCFGS